MRRRENWPCVAWALLWAAVTGAGCQPRPEFKVNVTDIGSSVNNLLARVWLVGPQTDGIPTAGIYGQTGILGNTILASVPVNLTQRISVPPCTVINSPCVNGSRQYSFGIDFADDLVGSHPYALLGVAAVTTVPAAGTSAQSDCLLAVASTQETLLGKGNVSIETATVSLLDGTINPTSCLNIAPPMPAPVNVVPTVSAVVIGHTQRDESTPERFLTIEGWDFQPNITVIIDDGCTPPLSLNYLTKPVDSSTMVKIRYVTPTEIGMSLGTNNVLAASCPGRTCPSVSVAIGTDSGTDKFPIDRGLSCK